MRILEMKSQHRRDFRAIYECESCGFRTESTGYDDRNFHDNVIPNMKCRECKLSRNDCDIKSEYTETKYPEHYQV